MINNVLIQLMNSSRTVQRFFAIALLLAVGLFFAGSIFAAISAISTKQDEISEQRRALGKIELLLSQRPTTVPEVDEPSQLFLPGENTALVQANLQSLVNQIASERQAIITSIGNVPSTKINGVSYVGVRADMQGTLEALHETITQIEISKPSLIIQEAIIRAAGFVGSQDPDAPLELVAQLSIFGLMDPALENGKAGADTQ